MTRSRSAFACSVAFAVLASAAASSARAAEPSPSAEGVEFFEKSVRPVLVERCFECHAGKARKGGLRMDSAKAVLRGGDNGPAAVPGKPDESAIIKAVRYVDDLRMPPKAKLPDREIDALVRWVKMGLPMPDAAASASAKADPGKEPAAGGGMVVTHEHRRWWAFRPVKAVPAPAVRDAAWPKGDIDRFILAALEAKGLRPAAPADPRTLIRRVTFDLTGLPPTPEEVDSFLDDCGVPADRRNDPHPAVAVPDAALAKLVDRLLASPAYGQRWGRHWLDLVRYTDSLDNRGSGSRGDISEAWRYRDWVVDAFNRDLPYDRFVQKQIAGDLLPPEPMTATDPATVPADREGIIATGALAIGEWGAGDADKDKMMTDIVDDQIDLVGRTFLGLTLACARCHDHKFDPIPTADYYGLAGIFFSTHIVDSPGAKVAGTPVTRIPLATPAQLEARRLHAAKLADLEKRLQNAAERRYAAFAESLLPDTAKYLIAAWERAADPAAAKTPLPEFARARGLHEFALKRWIEIAARPPAGDPGDGSPLTVPLRDVAGHAGVFGWRGKADCPNALVNTTDAEVAITTLRVPAKSVTVHPGPNGPVAVVWKSPIAGRVAISGRVRDGDKVCGDGIAWRIEHGSRTLAEGDVPNGGEQGFAGAALTGVEVRPGDRIRLVVLPKKDYTCDTTVVELRIADDSGGRGWDLRRDLLRDPLEGNPHSDDFGNKDTWTLTDLTGARPAGDGISLPADWARAVASGKREEVERSAAAFAANFRRTDAAGPYRIARTEDERLLPAEAREELADLRKELDALRKAPQPTIDEAHGAREGGVPGSVHAGFKDARIHIRGRYDRLGPAVPRHFPAVLSAADAPPPAIAPGTSGRLELARWLTRPDHPLTARVMVNRLWQHHFGEGLVRTPRNFGKLGEPPTHPELLDHLADRFVRSGWSIKAMHREMILSATYRQSSRIADCGLQNADMKTPGPNLHSAISNLQSSADPDNRLLGRMNQRRLEAEAVRDSLLWAAGRLDTTAGGPAFRDFSTPRRTLYAVTMRSDRSGFGPLFDSADPTTLVDRRTVSTVAPQALFLLNHPFVLKQTEALAKRLRALPGDDAARIAAAYRLLYARPPTPREAEIGLRYLSAVGEPARAWLEYAQVLLSANEFVFVD